MFVIKKEIEKDFKEVIGQRIEKMIDVEYVYQDVNDVPAGVQIPAERSKPWGTAHAIYCAKDAITEPFLVINADDFYGRDAYMRAAEFLKNANDQKPYPYGMVGYLVKNTITENGSVKRGVCEVENGTLLKITESSVERVEDGTIMAAPLSGAEPFEVAEDDTVSMNMLLFTPSIFEYIEKKFPSFLDENKDNDTNDNFIANGIIVHNAGCANDNF